MALALVLTTVSPEVGGVLVRGEKGTAKSTIVRALAAVLPPIDVVAGCRFSCDPADPDPACPDGPHTRRGRRRHAGRPGSSSCPSAPPRTGCSARCDLEQALADGVTRVRARPARRARTAASSTSTRSTCCTTTSSTCCSTPPRWAASTVERDGVSVAHAARFVLVGTMNPEEGELRPQLLDRFGLTVEVAAPRDPALRAEVVRRRLAFDADPDAFAGRYADAEDALPARIAAAQEPARRGACSPTRC